MKKIYNILMAVALGASMTTLTGCIDETYPTSGASDEQLAASASATEALLWAMPAKTIAYNDLGSSRHDDWGQGTLMHVRDVMGEEYVVTNSSYDWYQDYAYNQYQSEEYTYAYMPWYSFYKLIQTANNLIGAVDEATASDAQKGFLGAAYAFRAYAYLDAARCYEYLPTSGTDAINSDGKNVRGLTIPIVTESTTEEQARNNPRATHYTMFNFIISDLKKAEKYIPYLTESNKTLPHLDVVYGLMARAYMWNGSFMAEGVTVPADSTNTAATALSADKSFELADSCARAAIDKHSGSPLTQDEWTNTTTGFNTLSTGAWMWGMQLSKESDAVQTGIINWTSWCSNETTYGYASAGPIVRCAPAFYQQISNNDFRKLSWKAPEGSALAGQESYIDQEIFDGLGDLASLKFRPAEGNVSDYNVGSASAVPLMRVEEMYFIEAEAKVQRGDVINGKIALVDFMQKYRNPSYSCLADDKAGLINEIFFQKRVELWGEGRNFFDYKRLDKGVTRVYDGTTFASSAQFNVTGRPAWMNFVICRGEKTNNNSIAAWNNPDPSQCYTSGIAEYQAPNDNNEEATRRGLKKPTTHISF